MLICSKCKKPIEGDNYYTLAKTHNKLFIVPGVMKGSYSINNIVYCEPCSKKINLDSFNG